jgi:hypothetical protein
VAKPPPGEAKPPKNEEGAPRSRLHTPQPPPSPKGVRVAKPPPGEAKPRKNEEGDARSRLPRTHVTLDLVEMAGIEPASNGAEGGLLRAQSTSIFSAPEIT